MIRDSNPHAMCNLLTHHLLRESVPNVQSLSTPGFKSPMCNLLAHAPSPMILGIGDSGFKSPMIMCNLLSQ